MIGLVFGFFGAVLLLFFVLWMLGLLVESGVIWWILGGAIVLIIIALSNQPAPNSQLDTCIQNVDRNLQNYVGPASQATLNQAVAIAKNNCYTKYN